MNAKSGTAAIILPMLVAAGIATWLALGHSRSHGTRAVTRVGTDRQQAVVNNESNASASSEHETLTGEVSIDPASQETTRTVIVYYFHHGARCDACLTIEEYAEEVVQTDFFDAVQEGRLEWRPVNIEEMGNEHYQEEFELERQSVVLADLSGGTLARWKNLPEVWDLLDDQEAFQAYVSQEIWDFLGE
jgi:hypothetical protein